MLRVLGNGARMLEGLTATSGALDGEDGSTLYARDSELFCGS